MFNKLLNVFEDPAQRVQRLGNPKATAHVALDLIQCWYTVKLEYNTKTCKIILGYSKLAKLTYKRVSHCINMMHPVSRTKGKLHLDKDIELVISLMRSKISVWARVYIESKSISKDCVKRTS